VNQPLPPPWGNYLLKEIVETEAPAAISWLPQTIAWQIIFLLLMILLVCKIWQKYQEYKANAYRREALNWLRNLPRYDEANPHPAYRQIPALLKKTALHYYGREVVNQQRFSEWEHWLDLQCAKCDFENKCPQLFTELAHAPVISIDNQKMSVLIEQVKRWIKYHGAGND
jgi:hypothetical protein